MSAVPLRVAILGAGKVGRNLAAALRRSGAKTRLFGWRSGLPGRPIVADLLLLCVRDGQLATVVRRLGETSLLTPTLAVAHVGGAWGLEPLLELKDKVAGIAQAHPFLSFASPRVVHDLRKVPFLVDGDAVGRARVRKMLSMLGAIAVSGRGVERPKYHLAAALAANGTVALLSIAEQLLLEAGLDERRIKKFLDALLGSVKNNVFELGVAQALTGPVRRGDAETLALHLRSLRLKKRDWAELYRLLGRLQLPLARQLGEAPPQDLHRAERVLVSTSAASRAAKRRPPRR